MKKRRPLYPRLVLAVLIVLVMMSSATVISEARQIGFVEYTRNLTVGSIGDDVLWVQRFLNETRGAGLEEDGIYGNATRNAVTAFQSAYGLEADGIVGQLTLGRMQEVWHDKLEEEARQSIQAPPKVVNVTGVEVTPNVRTMKKGESYRFMITVQPSNATDKSVTLTSSNPSVAKVSSDGTVTALSAGTAVIRAKAGNKTGATTITVEEEKKIPVTAIKLTGRYQLIPYGKTKDEAVEMMLSGSTLELKEKEIACVYFAVSPSNATVKSVKKKSSGNLVASFVGSGQIRIYAGKPGTMSYSLQAGDGSGVTCTFTIKISHDWDKGTVTKAATTTTKGVRTYTCKCCGEAKREAIPVKKNTKNKGWKNISGKWYYYGNDGVKQTGWKKLSGKWYYLGANGVMRTGWKKLSGKWYYLGTNGVMQTGWKKLSGKWYYLGANGVMRTGWKKLSGKWYYLGANGVMRTGWKKLSGKWYYLGANGVMRTGWKDISGKRYYFGTDGAMRTGWQTIGGKRYFFESNGVMASQTDGERYRKVLLHFRKVGELYQKWNDIDYKWTSNDQDLFEYYNQFMLDKYDVYCYSFFYLDNLSYEFTDLDGDKKNELIIYRHDIIVCILSENDGVYKTMFANTWNEGDLERQFVSLTKKGNLYICGKWQYERYEEIKELSKGKYVTKDYLYFDKEEYGEEGFDISKEDLRVPNMKPLKNYK